MPSGDGIVQGQQEYDTFFDPKKGEIVLNKNGEPVYYVYTWNNTKGEWTKGAAAPAGAVDKINDLGDVRISNFDVGSANDSEAILGFRDDLLAKNAQLEGIIKNTKEYSPAAIANAKLILSANKATAASAGKTIATSIGKAVNSAGFKNVNGLPNFQAFADSVSIANPPSAVETIKANTTALGEGLKAGYALEQQYAPILAEVTGKAQREQALKNIQFNLDTPEIRSLRSKASRTGAENAQLAEFDAQFAGKSAAELSAIADAAFNAQTQEAKAKQFADLLPQYQASYLKTLPGAQQTITSLGQLGTQMAAQATQRPELTAFEQAIAGPQLQSNLGTIDQNLVNQYMNTMPGVVEGANALAQQANLDLAAGRSLTPEQERMATQAAREAYAARGMALGPQAITTEVLNRDELANQRYLQRQASAQQALGTISNLYQPALAQTYARQSGAEQYGLGAQGQAFSQALTRGEAQANRIQTANTLQANAAGIAGSVLGTQQQALSPVLSAYYNVPPSQGTLQTGVNQAQNQYAQAGLNVGNVLNSSLTGMNMLPYQTAMNQTAQRVGMAAGFAQGYAR